MRRPNLPATPDLRPELASFDCGMINFGERIFEGDVPFPRRMAEAFRRHGVRPELECFDTDHVGLALQLRDEGLLDERLLFQFVLGVPGSGVPATVGQVRTGLEDLWYARGDRATNARLVELAVRLAAELQRPVATPGEARAILGPPEGT